MGLEEGTRFLILAPVIRGKKGEHRKVLEDARKAASPGCGRTAFYMTSMRRSL